jgi:hypothetical protein
VFDHYRASTAPPGIGWSVHGTPAPQRSANPNLIHQGEVILVPAKR